MAYVDREVIEDVSEKDSKKMVEQIRAIAAQLSLVSYGTGIVVSLSLGIALGGHTMFLREAAELSQCFQPRNQPLGDGMSTSLGRTAASSLVVHHH